MCNYHEHQGQLAIQIPMPGDKDRDLREVTDKLGRRGRFSKVTANPDFHVPLDSLPIASICHFLVCKSEPLVVLCCDSANQPHGLADFFPFYSETTNMDRWELELC